MKRIEKLPWEFEFSFPRASWHRCVAHPYRWIYWRNPEALELQVSLPKHFSGARGRFPITFLDHELAIALLDLTPELGIDEVREAELLGQQEVVGVSLPPELLSQEVRVLLCLPKEDRSETKGRLSFDPWDARNEFLQVREREEDLLEFLSRYGCWNARDCRLQNGILKPSVHLPAEFWESQRVIREGLLKKSNAWLASSRHALVPKLNEKFPHLRQSFVGCSEGMEASVTIDIINRAEFEICAREDCPNPVKKEIKTGPKKIYCDELCGHIVASRKARALKRLAKNEAASRRVHRTRASA